jgi:hypothetical protein
MRASDREVGVPKPLDSVRRTLYRGDEHTFVLGFD